MLRLLISCFVITLVVGIVDSWEARAESPAATTWPQFRGVNGRNRAEGQVPMEFGPGNNEVWRVAVPSGNSSPVIWNDHVFLTGADDANLYVVCITRETGKLKWKREFGIEFERDYFHTDSSSASPTSCTDGERIYSYFGNYGIVAHDFDGELVWEKKFSAVKLQFGLGSSPILHNGKLFVVRDVPQFGALYCFNARNGDEEWMTPRPHKRSGYSTPVVWKSDGVSQIVIGGTGTLDGYDCHSGKLIWTVNNLPAIACTSPVVGDKQIVFGAWTTAHAAGDERTNSAFDDDLELTPEELEEGAAFVKRFDKNGDFKISRSELPASRLKGAFRFMDANNDGQLSQQELDNFRKAPTAPGRNVLIAVKPGGRGDITDTHVIWEAFKKLPYVASPLIHGDRVYYAKKGGFLTRVNLASGSNAYTRRLGLGGEYYATPLAINDRILVCAERGTVFVIEPNDKLEVLATNEIGEDIAATPAVVDGTVYLRTAKHLYAFGSR